MVLSKCLSAHDSRINIYIVLALFMLTGTVQKSGLRLHFSQNQLVVTPILEYHFLGQILKQLQISAFHRQQFQGPQETFKIHPIITHLDSKLQTL
jgi:hypothetical protein